MPKANGQTPSKATDPRRAGAGKKRDRDAQSPRRVKRKSAASRKSRELAGLSIEMDNFPALKDIPSTRTRRQTKTFWDDHVPKKFGGQADATSSEESEEESSDEEPTQRSPYPKRSGAGCRSQPFYVEEYQGGRAKRSPREEQLGPYGLHKGANAWTSARASGKKGLSGRAGDCGSTSESDIEANLVRGLGARQNHAGPNRNSETLQEVRIDETVDWKSIGGMEDKVREVKECILFPLMYSDLFTHMGAQPPSGILFHGPPGTGKTLLVRALAGSCRKAKLPVTLYLRKGADILSKYVGEGERQLRLLFEEAKKRQPSIIFFDEIDGLAPMRCAKNDQVHTSIVATLLALMDGLEGRGQIVVIGATNRPDAIDPGLRRPGRFDREIRFTLPEAKERAEILKVHTKAWPVQPPEAFRCRFAEQLVGCSGADIAAVCQESVLHAVRRTFPQIYREDDLLQIDIKQCKVAERDMQKAAARVLPSTTRSATSTCGPRQIGQAWRELFAKAIAQVGDTLREHTRPTSVHALLMLPEDDAYVSKYVVRAALRELAVPVFSLATSDGKFDENREGLEGYVVRTVKTAVQRAPSVLYMPRMHKWAQLAGPDACAQLKETLEECIPSDCPVLFLSTGPVEGPYDLMPACVVHEAIRPPTANDQEHFWSTTLQKRFLDLVEQEWERVAMTAKLERLPKASQAPCLADAGDKLAIHWGQQSAEDRKRMEGEESTVFALFRTQIREVLHSMLRHPRFRVFSDRIEDPDYKKVVKDPFCLTDMLRQNENQEYFDLESVKSDFKKIVACAQQWDKRKPKKFGAKEAETVDLYAKEFEDQTLLKLSSLDEEVTSSLPVMRAQRESREAWDTAEKDKAKAKVKKEPAADGKKSGGFELIDKELPNSTRGIITAYSKELQHKVRDYIKDGKRTMSGDPQQRDLVGALLVFLRDIDAGAALRAKADEKPKLAKFMEGVFRSKHEHLPLCQLHGDDLKRLDAAADEFCSWRD